MLIFNDSDFACRRWWTCIICVHASTCAHRQCTCSLVCDLYVRVCNLDSPASVEVLFLSRAQESHSFLFLHLSFSLSHTDALWSCLESHTTTQLSKCEPHSDCQYMLSCDSRSLTALTDLKGYLIRLKKSELFTHNHIKIKKYHLLSWACNVVKCTTALLVV